MDNNLQLLWTIDFIKKVLYDKPEYTGRLELNFFKGSVSNINRLESIQLPKNKTLDNKIVV